ncbi:uncharacterized protein LOC121990957 [Zingiber officinale]|uniref:uncharacterized protein LOC121990957 n=1 Tax=Zingiber officinale TaxID=94328 RepID=UPI001C4B6746|nr:uncharacterized protein LOC121990957 [Zingiber officinale]
MQDSQIAQIAQSVSRAQGTFPGKPDLNPVEHCNRIELRSGRTMGDPQIITQKELDSEKEPTLLMSNQTQNRDGEEVTKKVEETLQATPQNQAIPFPQKLIASQKDEEFNRFLKKIKEICIEKEEGRLRYCSINRELQRSPYSEFSTKASGSKKFLHTVYPMGIVEDVSVEVGGCIVPTDFIILDMEEDPKMLIILGRPFLATAGAIIDVKSHKLSLEIGKEKIEFDLSNSSICNPSSQGNSHKTNIQKVEECSSHDVHVLHELAVSSSWVWRH